jgi:small-conductance mechanosensitive channel
VAFRRDRRIPDESSVDFIVRRWVNTADYWNVYCDVIREVKMRFDREGIAIPFPQQDVHLYMERGARLNGKSLSHAHGFTDSTLWAQYKLCGMI